MLVSYIPINHDSFSLPFRPTSSHFLLLYTNESSFWQLALIKVTFKESKNLTYSQSGIFKKLSFFLHNASNPLKTYIYGNYSHFEVIKKTIN